MSYSSTSTSATSNATTFRMSNGWATFDFHYTGPQAEPARGLRERIRDDERDYALLGCTPGDPPDKLRREWRRLAKIHHPDKGGDRAMFEQIREAYARLARGFR